MDGGWDAQHHHNSTRPPFGGARYKYVVFRFLTFLALPEPGTRRGDSEQRVVERRRSCLVSEAKDGKVHPQQTIININTTIRCCWRR